MADLVDVAQLALLLLAAAGLVYTICAVLAAHDTRKAIKR